MGPGEVVEVGDVGDAQGTAASCRGWAAPAPPGRVWGVHWQGILKEARPGDCLDSTCPLQPVQPLGS